MSSNVFELLSKDNVVFRAYAFWATVLLLKTLAMAMLTGAQRFRTKTFANPEDLPSKKLKVKLDDPDVERVRRAHRNDLENVIPFILMGLLYVLTNPAAGLAVMLIRIAAIARIAHTIVYAVVVIPQPARALAFFVAYGVTIYMGIQSFFYFFYV